MSELTITVTKHTGVKCPRCFRFTHEGRANFDDLCSRCCAVLIADYPQHESIPHILAAQERQREQS